MRRTQSKPARHQAMLSWAHTGEIKMVESVMAVERNIEVRRWWVREGGGRTGRASANLTCLFVASEPPTEHPVRTPSFSGLFVRTVTCCGLREQHTQEKSHTT